MSGSLYVRAVAMALMASVSIAALSTGAAYAQTAQNAGGEEIVLDEINVSGEKAKATTEGTESYTTGEMSSSTGLGLSIKETPQSVTVQTRQRLDDQNLQETKDVLRQTPGIHFAETGSQGSDSNSFYARGFPVNNFSVDGIRQSGVYRGADEISDTFVYDRVEIVRRPELSVIVIADHGDIPLAVDAMKRGAADFIEKPVDNDRLLAAVSDALKGLSAREQLEQKRSDIAHRLDSLSPREREVMVSLVRGNPNKIVAHELGISVRTVEIHRAHVMSKTGAGSLAELVRIALVAGTLTE